MPAEKQEVRQHVIGEISVREITVRVCMECGCVVTDTGLCNYDCSLDASPRTPGTFLTRTYERIDKLIREEAPNAD